MSEGNILVVDDDDAMRRSVVTGLRDVGFSAVGHASAVEALEELRAADFDVVLTDVRMREMDGIALCTRIVAERPDIPVVLMTAFGSMEAAVAGIRAAAYDFVTKPIDIDTLSVCLAKAVRHRRLHAEVRRLGREPSPSAGEETLVGESDSMIELRRMVSRFARSQASVLITGESGTGKEVVARALHAASDRASGPFVAVNCAALPEGLIESELFGHARGAFTDARQERRGVLVQAAGGTLLLDEVGEMPLPTQAKLLRALQERSIRPLGAEREISVDVRVLAATNRNLEAAVEQGRFREDLYFRIHVLHLALPPLRSRGADVLLLAQQFLAAAAARAGKDVVRIGPAAADLLLSYRWPGNVRELANCVEHAVALARYDHLVPEDLPPRIRDLRPRPAVVAAGSADLAPLEDVEREHILRVVEACSGNKRLAARMLGLDRKTLYRKLERWGGERGPGDDRDG